MAPLWVKDEDAEAPETDEEDEDEDEDGHDEDGRVVFRDDGLELWLSCPEWKLDSVDTDTIVAVSKGVDDHELVLDRD